MKQFHNVYALTFMTGQTISTIVSHSVLQQSHLMKMKHAAAYHQHKGGEWQCPEIKPLSGVVQNVKSRGPNTDPWGTPKVRSDLEDRQSPIQQCIYLHSMLATSLVFCSLRSHNGITVSIPRVKTNVGPRHFALSSQRCETTSHYQSSRLPLLRHSGNI